MTEQDLDDNTAESYKGATTAAECRNCGHTALVPVRSFSGKTGHCTECDQMVEWEYRE